MKVGDWVRFYDRSWTEIGQITGYVEDSHLKVVKCRDGYYDLDNFIKYGEDITDVLETGDILTIRDILGNLSKVEVDENFKLLSGKIVSIVTKEQFESMEYRIGE